MKKILVMFLCAILCACSPRKASFKPNKTDRDSSVTVDESVTESPWVGTYKKTDSDMTLEITATEDLENAMAFKFSDDDHTFEDYCTLDNENENKAKCDLGEDGIVITFEKKEDEIKISVEGEFFYLDNDITGTFRR